MGIGGFDHNALPTKRPIAMMEFYHALGSTVPDEKLWHDAEDPRLTIHCGNQKINLHEPSRWQYKNFTLREHPGLPGRGDMCFVWKGSLD